MPYLFDGYNVYHAARKLTDYWDQMSPALMCRLVENDIRYLRDVATVVFDGTYPRQWPGANESIARMHKRWFGGYAQWPADIEAGGVVSIVYSGPETDADSILEEMIRQSSAPKRLVVVSADRRIVRAGRRRRAKTFTSRDYLEGMIKRANRPDPPPQDPPEKRKGLAKKDLRPWLEVFGIDPDPEEDLTDFIEF